MNIVNEYIRLCNSSIELLKSKGNEKAKKYIKEFENEMKAAESGDFLPEGEDLLCLKVFYEQLKELAND